MNPVAIDKFTLNKTVGGVNFDFETSCGLVESGSQGLKIALHSSPTNKGEYASLAISHTYPNQWTVPTTLGTPTGWPGGSVLLRTRVQPSMRQFAKVQGTNSTSITASFAVPTLLGNSVVLCLNQWGTDVSGNTLVNPTWPAGASALLTATLKDFHIAWLPNVNAMSSVTVSGIGSADMSRLYAMEFFTAPSASVIASNFKQAQAGATLLSSGSLSPATPQVWLAAFFMNRRQSAVLGTAATWSLPTGGFTTRSTDSRDVISGTPVYESMSGAVMENSFAGGGSYVAGITSSKSYVWNSGIVAFR